MKNSKWLTIAGAVVLMGWLTACNNNAGNNEHDNSDMDSNETSMKMEEKSHSDLEQFTMEAASDGKMEIQMAQVALNRSSNEKVKELARMIETDHQDANQKLADVARTENWNIPDQMMEKHQQKLKELKDTKDEDFDKKYVDIMVSGHKEAIDKFENVIKEAKDDSSAMGDMDDHRDRITNDQNRRNDAGNSAEMVNLKEAPALISWVQSTLPVLRKHLEKAQSLQSEMGS